MIMQGDDCQLTGGVSQWQASWAERWSMHVDNFQPTSGLVSMGDI